MVAGRVTPEPDARKLSEKLAGEWKGEKPTPEPDADVAAVKRGMGVGPPPTTSREQEELIEGFAALDRLAARLQEAERERDIATDAMQAAQVLRDVAEARVKALREALDRIADPVAEWQAHKIACKIGSASVRLPYEIARAALAATEELE